MSDSYLPLLSNVISVLKADAPLTALVPAVRIYSDVPDNPTFPYISVTIDSQPFDTKTELGMEHTLQVSIFGRNPDPSQVGFIRAAVYNALHRQEASLTSAAVDSIIMNGVSPTFKDPDGQTWVGVVQFQVIIS